MHIVAGVVVYRDNKFLLVQEGQGRCRGQWNVPAGHVDMGETLFEAAKREAKEETNCDVELTGVCQVGNYLWTDDYAVTVIFTADLVSDDIQPLEGEILDVKWFTYDEICAMKDKIRSPNLIFGALNTITKNQVASLDLIAVTRDENSHK